MEQQDECEEGRHSPRDHARRPILFGGADRQTLRSVVAEGPEFVAVGTDGVGGREEAAVWVGE